jgi:hypothetical protein
VPGASLEVRREVQDGSEAGCSGSAEAMGRGCHIGSEK